MRVLIVLGILFLLVAPVHAEYWFDNFDSYPTGKISVREGWSANSAGVEVVATGDSLPNALSLPYSGASGVYGRYDLNPSFGSRILRVSFRLYRDNTEQTVQVQLRNSTTTRLEISTDTSDGTVTVSGTDTGVVYPTGQYATFTLFYNGANNSSRVPTSPSPAAAGKRCPRPCIHRSTGTMPCATAMRASTAASTPWIRA